MFIIQIPYLDLMQTFKSGQHLRWKIVGENKFVIINGPKIVKVSQNKDRFCFDCTEEDFYNIWYDYFDVGTDYLSYNYKIHSVDEDYIIESSNRGRGIRIIKQNIFEVTVASIFDYFYNGDVSLTDSAINLLCTVCGKKRKNTIREAGQLIWYEFPTTEQILRQANTLFRMNMLSIQNMSKLIDVCNYVSVNGYKKLPSYLRGIFGDDYVISNIKLYALHKLNYMPINDEMLDIFITEFDCDDADDFFEWYISYDINVECICGLLGRYLYYNKNNPPKTTTLNRRGI